MEAIKFRNFNSFTCFNQTLTFAVSCADRYAIKLLLLTAHQRRNFLTNLLFFAKTNIFWVQFTLNRTIGRFLFSLFIFPEMATMCVSVISVSCHFILNGCV